jgi:MerR family transcriptional regulator, light-induced transcriptional regulator
VRAVRLLGRCETTLAAAQDWLRRDSGHRGWESTPNGTRVDADLLRLWKGRFRDAQSQHAKLNVCLDFLAIDPVRQLEAAGKRSVTALSEMQASFLPFFLLVDPLAANRQDTVLRRYLDVLGFHPRNLDHEYQLLVSLADVDRGGPLTPSGMSEPKRILEKAINLPAQAEYRRGRSRCVQHTCLTFTGDPDYTITGQLGPDSLQRFYSDHTPGTAHCQCIVHNVTLTWNRSGLLHYHLLLTTRMRLAPHLHPMRVVTRRTGLSPDLLRAWERRYEVVTPSRSKGGRRLYSDADIERLRLLYRATLAGRSIGLVADLSPDALAAVVRQDAAADSKRDDSADPLTGGSGPRALHALPSGAPYLASGMRAVERLDAALLEAILRRAVVVLPAVTFLDAVVVPLLADVGTRWREGTLRPVHGHLASVVLRRVLDRVIESAGSPLATSNVVVATPAGQTHEFGALLVAATVAAEGWRVTYLGTDLPAEDIGEAAVRTRAGAVALSLVYPAGDVAVGDELRRLRRILPARVALLVGGAASASYAAVLDDIGAIRPDGLAGFRAELVTLRRARRRGTATR